MKRNIWLRLAACLLLAAVVSTGVSSGTWAKYAASATVTASARVAKFSFLAGSSKGQQEDETTGPSSGVYKGPEYFGPHDTDPANHWQEIVVNASTVNNFEVPAFSSEYWNPTNWYRTPLPREVTVRGEEISPGTRRIVTAPGTGSIFGSGTPGNPNIGDGEDGDYDGDFSIEFKNSSEVTVRFRLSVNYDDSDLKDIPFIISAPARTSEQPGHPDAWARVDWKDSHGMYPVLTNADIPSGTSPRAMMNHGPYPDTTWIVLAPGEDYTVTFSLIWWFDVKLDGSNGTVRQDNPYLNNNPSFRLDYQNWPFSFWAEHTPGTINAYPNDNAAESQLGMWAQQYKDVNPNGNEGKLREDSSAWADGANTYGDADVRLVFKLEAEQIN